MRIGIDLGGTKTAALALAADGTELARRQVPTPAGDYAAIVRMIAGLVAALEQETGRRGSVGVGIPGALSPISGLVKNANTTALIGRPFDRDLAAALGRPVRLANDANCFTLSEATDGAGAGLATVFGVILGTGCGGGISVRGQLIVGPNAVAGEWGHNPLPWANAEEFPGPPCYCGRRGCIETFVSGPGLSRDHLAQTGETCTAAEIAARAEAGEESALASLERYEGRLARALSGVVNLLDPDVIVLGGGLSGIARLYRTVPDLLCRHAFSLDVGTVLRPARHGAASGVRGAAWLWPAEAPADPD